MNKTTITDIFLDNLKEESTRYKPLETTQYTISEKKSLIRSLMNIRMPKNISDKLLHLQDNYLQEELMTKGIITLSNISTIKEQLNSKSFFAEKVSLWQGDITRLKVDAIVNAANSQMLGCFIPCHPCIDNAIHSAAGMQLRAECNHIMNQRKTQYGKSYKEPTGTATLTKDYNLPCNYVIHTVGPICFGSLTEDLCKDLQNCYENILKCCITNHIKSVAFCCISTGEFHFPNDKAAQIAWHSVSHFLETYNNCIERIIFNIFTDNDRKIYENILRNDSHIKN